ncbi:hypothetical protein [Methanobrevibacter arboriphilus]|uniref:hypothetical protein n=1 Tax=Methanobrevibacter arboriphilus TaxID=39441 RepID=UPI0006CF7896|nr:hypothetical protein [Methanobrevibacter arboriphilus]
MHSINYKEVIEKSSLVALASPKEIRYSIPRKIKWDNMTPDERNKVKEDFKKQNPNRTFYAPSFKTGKNPAYSWKHAPREYKGYNDSVYGSAVLCNYLPEYDLYLAVIDLDSPKNPEDISMSDLLTVCEGGWINKTHTRITPSGGVIIYIYYHEISLNLNNLHLIWIIRLILVNVRVSMLFAITVMVLNMMMKLLI